MRDHAKTLAAVSYVLEAANYPRGTFSDAHAMKIWVPPLATQIVTAYETVPDEVTDEMIERAERVIRRAPPRTTYRELARRALTAALGENNGTS